MLSYSNTFRAAQDYLRFKPGIDRIKSLTTFATEQTFEGTSANRMRDIAATNRGQT
jgi:hypothetical protein